jgi:hypothetical protein
MAQPLDGAKEVITEQKARGEHPVLLAPPPGAQRSATNRAAGTTRRIASGGNKIGYRWRDENRRARMNHHTRGDIQFVLLLTLVIVVLGVATCLFGPWLLEAGL